MMSRGPMFVTRQPTSLAALIARLQFSTTLNVAFRSAARPSAPMFTARRSTASPSISATSLHRSTPSAHAAKSGGSAASWASGRTEASAASPPRREFRTSVKASASSEEKECCELPAPWRTCSCLMAWRLSWTMCARSACDLSMASNSAYDTSPSPSVSTWATSAATAAAGFGAPSLARRPATSCVEMRPEPSASKVSKSSLTSAIFARERARGNRWAAQMTR
mmetsp:Transcript_5512/g.15505  ORF Transcript_5512/g.15505 Transcript_5512/m.15505 type:complete len:223 (+) Transcript_5512:1396-2064(+)